MGRRDKVNGTTGNRTPYERILGALPAMDRAAVRLGAHVEMLVEIRIYNDKANTLALRVRLAGQDEASWRHVTTYVSGPRARKLMTAAKSRGWKLLTRTYVGDSSTPLGRGY